MRSKIEPFVDDDGRRQPARDDDDDEQRQVLPPLCVCFATNEVVRV